MNYRVRSLCKIIAAIVFLFASGASWAQSDAVTVSLNPSNPGATVPSNFSGLSFEEADLIPNSSGQYYFVNTNQPLITLFNTLGVKSLRIGGNTADSGPQPANADIDALFGFAEAANVKVLYTLRLKTFDAAAANATASYIMNQYSSDMTCFEIGNEPDVYLGSYSTYQTEAQTYIDTNSASNPTAKFCGPNDTGGAASWDVSFAQYFASTGTIALVGHHDYFGGNGGSTTGAAARDKLLSATMLSNYSSNANKFVSSVLSTGLNYRISETNSYYDGGSSGCSNTFAEALWDLDYMYWWASDNAAGINFHTGDTVSGGTAYYSFFTTTTGGYDVHPGAYGALAFSLGGHGRIVPVTLSNPSGMDLTAYGILASDNSLWVTIINKTHETGSITANLTLDLGGSYSNGNMWLMQAPNNDDSQTTGITLGGGEVDGNGTWSGTSEPVSVSASIATLNLSPASAAVIQFVPSSCTSVTVAPASLTVTGTTTNSVSLSWATVTPPANCTVNSYIVYGGTTANPTTQVGTTTGTTFTNTGLTANTTYYYTVAAVDADGTSPVSAQVSGLTQTPPCSVAPPAPTGVTGGTTSNSVSLSWNAVTPPANCSPITYTVYGGTTPNPTTVLASGLTATSLNNTGLTASTTYYYGVAAVDSYGSSPVTPFSIATQPLTCGAVTSAPAGLAVTSTTSSAVSLSWSATTPPTGCTVSAYAVFGGTTANPTTQVGTVTGTTFTNTGLLPSTTYYYDVKAIDAFGTSQASGQVQGATQPGAGILDFVAIAAGGPAESDATGGDANFVADEYFSGGGDSSHTSHTINLTQPGTNAAPMAVYQYGRAGVTTYTVPGMVAGSLHTVLLHFSENYYTATGKRVFNVAINGTSVLANFDIYKTAGAEYTAVVESFTATANSSGDIVIAFAKGTANQPLIDGIEIR